MFEQLLSVKASSVMMAVVAELKRLNFAFHFHISTMICNLECMHICRCILHKVMLLYTACQVLGQEGFAIDLRANIVTHGSENSCQLSKLDEDEEEFKASVQ